MRVAGIDSSTQSTKVVVIDASTGEVLRNAARPHPAGTSCPPQLWWDALLRAIDDIDGLDDVSALSVAGQQHAMVLLDDQGQPLRDALLWNDTRSAEAATELKQELGVTGWVEATGLSPVASFTATKLRWVADHEPELVKQIAAICLPHDYLSWRILGTNDLADLTTDRSDASGTMYFDPESNQYRIDLLAQALRIDQSHAESIQLPRVLGPHQTVGQARGLGLNAIVAPGAGDNAAAGLGLGAGTGDVWISLGTSGVVAGISATAWHDTDGLVAGFADATGQYLPLLCTLNGAPVLDRTAAMLGVDHERLANLALDAVPGAGGLVLLPLFSGERTPNLPDATGSLTGITGENLTPENLARAAVEGLLCLMGYCLARLATGMPIERVMLTGGGARSKAIQTLAPAILGYPVELPPEGEHVAWGAARQAAWAATGELPVWHNTSQLLPSTGAQAWLQQRWNQQLLDYYSPRLNSSTSFQSN